MLASKHAHGAFYLCRTTTYLLIHWSGNNCLKTHWTHRSTGMQWVILKQWFISVLIRFLIGIDCSCSESKLTTAAVLHQGTRYKHFTATFYGSGEMFHTLGIYFKWWSIPWMSYKMNAVLHDYKKCLTVKALCADIFIENIVFNFYQWCMLILLDTNLLA